MKRQTAVLSALIGSLFVDTPPVQACQQERDTHTIAPGVGVGEFAFGMTKHEVIKKLGKPRRIFWDPGEHYTLDDLPPRYIMDFNGLSFGMHKKLPGAGSMALAWLPEETNPHKPPSYRTLPNKYFELDDESRIIHKVSPQTAFSLSSQL